MGYFQWITWGVVDKLRSGYCLGKKDECLLIEDMSGNKVREFQVIIIDEFGSLWFGFIVYQ